MIRIYILNLNFLYISYISTLNIIKNKNANTPAAIQFECRSKMIFGRHDAAKINEHDAIAKYVLFKLRS